MKASTSNVQHSTFNVQGSGGKLSAFSSQLSATDARYSRVTLTADSRTLTANEVRPRLPTTCRLLSAASFTILELLAVIVIIAALAGMILGVTKYAMMNAAESRAKSEIAAMETALESYKNDNGAYPLSTITRDSGSGNPPTSIEKNNSKILYLALSPPPGSKQYFKFKLEQLREDPPGAGFYYIIDPFGSPYNYYCSPPPVPATQKNQVTFDLWSYGPDGLNDTADDIVNWRR